MYRYKRLNFGIASAAEVFQNIIQQQIQHIPGAINISDDILVFGRDEEDHERNLKKTLKSIQDVGLTLNEKKCQFYLKQVEFFGHIFSEKGLFPDPSKIKAIKDIKLPENFKQLRSFLGMVNYCGRFVENLSKLTEPLRRTLR